MNSVTVNLTKDDFYQEDKPIMNYGDIVSIRGEKRICLKVLKVGIGEYSLKPFYHPSPGSVLRKNKKSVFSKIKIPIIKNKFGNVK